MNDRPTRHHAAGDATTGDPATGDPTAGAPTAGDDRQAFLRVVRGAPDDAEVAAVTAVLAAVLAEGAAADRAADPRAVPSRWTDRAAHLRRPLGIGPDAWRTSTWPG